MPRVRYLLDGVVRGIGDYGNAFGVPTVAGEVYFDATYEGNPLVNAMSVGIVNVGATVSAVARGVGNPVYIVGSSTGRDGIHGATFASEEISEASEAKRPSVQVGDPFTEKLLLEATLEVIKSGVVVGMQDMGAAGITCSTCEMSAKGGSGMVLQLERVPMRETGMTPYEVMLSESQERMLVVCHRGREAELETIFQKWDLHATRIGEVTENGRVQVFWKGERVADVPAEHLVLGGGAPVYVREARRPDYLDRTSAFTLTSIPDLAPESSTERLCQVIGAPNIASKRWIFEQYDTSVRTNTIIGPGPSDAAVVRLKGTRRGLAVKTDCNGRFVYLNPRRGGQIAVAESARNVVCAGGEPLAITNCLNFGNPYKPEVYWVFKEALAGMGDACRALDTPVTGGNVSFYNENPDSAVFPTPTIGMVGLVEDVERDATTVPFKSAGDLVVLLSPQGWRHRNDLGGSEYLAFVHGLTAGDAPHLDLDEERAVQRTLLRLIRAGLVRSAHDVSDGGLAICLAECALHASGLGADIAIDGEEPTLRNDALLFGEAQSRVVISIAPAEAPTVEAMASVAGVQATVLGRVTDGPLKISRSGTTLVDVSPSDLRTAYEQTIPTLLRGNT
jgi:phosphoribosylformylglycinamidine synthase